MMFPCKNIFVKCCKAKSLLKSVAIISLLGLSIPATVMAQEAESSSETRDQLRKKLKVKKEKAVRLTGIAGGKLKIIHLPTTITGAEIFHSDDRVFGFKFNYLDKNDDRKTTEIIGGDAGGRSSFKLNQTALSAVRLHYSADPAKHYLSPVLVGMEFDLGGQDPASGAVSTKSYGKILKGSNKIIEEISLEAGQTIDYIAACVSPQDRNGRVFSLKLAKAPDIPPTTNVRFKGSKESVLRCRTIKPAWANQPLGPKRVPDEFGNVAPDKYSLATGFYRKSNAAFRLIEKKPGDPNEPFKVSNVKNVYFEFGDRFLKIEEAGRRRRSGGGFKLMENPGDFTFAYKKNIAVSGAVNTHREVYGVDVETVQLGRGKNDKTVITVTYLREEINNETGKSERKYSIKYNEVALQGSSANVASRDRAREEVEETGQSAEGLFEQQSVIKHFGFLYNGYDFLNMSPESYNAGVKGEIFTKGGPYQYYLTTIANAAVPDGIVFINKNAAYSKTKSFSLASAKSISESTSNSLGGAAPIKGIPVGLNYSNTKSKTMSEEKSIDRSFTESRKTEAIYVTDLPNAFLSIGFSKEFLCLYEAVEKGRACHNTATKIAQNMVKTYGTHYAYAIGMGGRARETTRADKEKFVKELKESEEISFFAGDDSKENNKPNINGKRGTESSDTDRQEDNQSETTFTAFGGSGANLSMWDASPENAIPILYDLRPISELMNIVIFSKAKEIYLSRKNIQNLKYNDKTINQVIALLDKAIEEYIQNNAIKPDDRNDELYVYKLNISGVKCEVGGDDGVLEVEVEVDDDSNSGLTVTYIGSDGKFLEPKMVWKPTVAVDVSCHGNGIVGHDAFSSTFVVEIPPNKLNSTEPLAFLSLDGLEEDDGITLLPDDPINFRQLISDIVGKPASSSMVPAYILTKVYPLENPSSDFGVSPPIKVTTYGGVRYGMKEDSPKKYKDEIVHDSPRLSFSYTWERVPFG